MQWVVSETDGEQSQLGSEAKVAQLVKVDMPIVWMTQMLSHTFYDTRTADNCHQNM